MSKYEERVQVVTERTSSAMYAFWSAMLTAHTVLLSVAVALPSAISSVVAWQFKLVGLIATEVPLEFRLPRVDGYHRIWKDGK